MNEREPVNKEVVEQEIRPWSDVVNQFEGNFDNGARWRLIRLASPQDSEPLERQDYFGTIAAAAFAQGHTELASRLIQESKKPLPNVLQGGKYPDVAGPRFTKGPNTEEPKGRGWRDEGTSWVRYQNAEEAVRYDLVDALATAMYDLSERKDSNHGYTIADIPIKDGIQKEVFLYLSKLLVKDPANLSAGEVEVERERFERRTVESVIPGYDFVQWRHNRSGKFGQDDDSVKIFLEKPHS